MSLRGSSYLRPQVHECPMTDPPSSSHQRPELTSRAVQVRFFVAAAILLLEYLAVSYAFDAQTVAQRGGIWTVLGETGRIGPLVVVAATALFLAPAAKRRALLRGAALPRLKPALLLLHLLSALAFWAMTRLAFGSEEPEGPALFWILGWATLGALVPASLLVGLLAETSWLAKVVPKALGVGGLLGLVAWGAGSLSTSLWAPLSYATFLTVASILQYAGFELYANSTERVLELEGFRIDVAPVCSGFEGIGLFFVLMIGFLYQVRDSLRFPRAFLLLPLGMGAVWYGNAFRIAALMVVGARLDPEVAIGSFHSKAGWVFFCAITLFIGTMARRSPFFSKDAIRSGPEERDKNPAAPFLVPLLAWMALGLATSSFSDGHDPFYPLRVVATALVLMHYRRELLVHLHRPSAISWVVGILVGIAWLVLPVTGPSFLFGSSLPDLDRNPGFGVIWLFFRSLGAILIVPVCEEFAFRGFLARRVKERDFERLAFVELTLPGILLSSLAFGILHDQWILGVFTGVLYSLVIKRTGKLVDGIVAHALSNAVIAMWVLTMGSFQYW